MGGTVELGVRPTLSGLGQPGGQRSHPTNRDRTLTVRAERVGKKRPMAAGCGSTGPPTDTPPPQPLAHPFLCGAVAGA